MSKYIDANVLKEKLRYSMLFKMGFLNHCADAGREIPKTERQQILDSIDLHKAFIELIDEQSERKTGEWLFEEYPDGYYHSKCSICKHWFIEDAFLKPYKYCPNCGASMKDGESNR